MYAGCPYGSGNRTRPEKKKANMADKSETDSHRVSMIETLNSLRHNEKFCDVYILVEDTKFPAHKNVLCASSDYFNSMFTSDFQESKKDEIELEGKSKIFEELLEFAYTGEMSADIPIPDAIDMLSMAAYLQLQHGAKLLSSILLKAIKTDLDLSLQEVYRIWSLAELLGKGMCVEDLITTAMSVLAKNFVKFSEVDGFSPDVSCEFLEMCLVRNNLALGAMKEDEDEDGVLRDKFRDRELREEKILDIVMLWLQHDWMQRKKHALSLLSKVRLGIVSPDKIRMLLDSTNMTDVPKCIVLLHDVIGRLSLKDEAVKENSKSDDNVALAQMFRPRGLFTAPVHIDSEDNCLKYFDGKSGIWFNVVQFDDSPFHYLTKYSSVAIDGQLYVAGGRGGREDADVKKSFCCYDMDDGFSQEILPDMQTTRSACSLVHMDNYIYAIGGVESITGDSETPTLSVERYNLNREQLDIRAASWETVASLPSDVWNPHAVVFKGKLLVCGTTRNISQVLRDQFLIAMAMVNRADIDYVLCIYDPKSNTWQRHILEPRQLITCMQGRQNYAMLHIHNGECYLLGNVMIDAYHNPRTKWFRTTVNKLEFRELDDGSLTFLQTGPSLSQDDVGGSHYYSSYFCIDNDLFIKSKGVFQLGVKTTDDNMHEVLDLWHSFPCRYLSSFGAVTFDRDVV